MIKAHLSIIIATYKRPHLLVRCLESLNWALQKTPGVIVELGVIINGSDPETEGILSRFIEKNVLFDHVNLKISSTRQTPSEVRNIMVSEAEGEWVFFLDDDAYVDKNLFQTFQDLREKFPKSIVFGGPNLNPPNSNLFQTACSLALASPMATWVSSSRYRKGERGRSCGEEALILCNLFVRKNALGQNPFPSRFICCEENFFLQKQKISREATHL